MTLKAEFGYMVKGTLCAKSLEVERRVRVFSTAERKGKCESIHTLIKPSLKVNKAGGTHRCPPALLYF